MSKLHDRMPVVLEKDAGDRWLDGDEQVLSEAAELIAGFRAWPVDRRVNNARNEGAELVKPVGEVLSG
jgi:putative SOS response-associated peptidase YedK